MIWGSDLMKGFKLPKDALMGDIANDLMPFQAISMEDKTIDWVKAVADLYEMAGWNNIQRKAQRLHRNRMMRKGELNKSDYIINPNSVSFAEAVGWQLPNQDQSPLEQFYSLAPSFIDAMKGEYLKRDNKWTIEVVDSGSVNELFSQKEEAFKQVVYQQALVDKQQALYEQGLSEGDPEQFQQAMAQAKAQLDQVEMKSKSFRTTGAKWAEKVISIHDKRYNLHELDPDAFEAGLADDGEIWHLDLLEDDFKLETIDLMWGDWHKAKHHKYISDGDYVLWFQWMSTGDIVNKYGRRMKEEDILKLKDAYVKTKNMMVLDQYKGRQGAYYDRNKNFEQATELNPALNDVKLGQELAYNFPQSGNFMHNIDLTQNAASPGNRNGHPQMFRVMTLYWRSMRRVGWLTKIKRDGTTVPPDWVDENFRVTEDPVYDTSITKEKSKTNLLYGEHIDWTWAPEWRKVIKISANQMHTMWADGAADMDGIYIDGGPVQYQFKGLNNPFDSLPPVEGAEYRGLINPLRGHQIMYNIAMNKVPRKILEDKGMKIAVDRRAYTTNTAGTNVNQLSPRENMEDMLDNSQIFEVGFTRESLEGLGQPMAPTVLNLSTAQEATFYLQMADQIKWSAGETVGITRQRLGAQKASETATSIQQGIAYSETQTEYLFEQHANVMQRVRQRMLDATQFYTTFNETTRQVYMNDKEENVFLQIEGTENLLTHYNIYLTSRANVRAALQTISNFLQNENTLPIRSSAKLEAMIDGSIPKILNLVRESEYQQDMMAQQEQERNLSVQQQQLQQQQAQFEEEQKRLDAREAAKNQTDVQVATIRALGGMQTDVNTDGQVDSQANLDHYFQQQQLAQQGTQKRQELQTKSQMDMNKLAVEREKSQNKLAGDKYKADASVEVAKINPPNTPSKKK